MRLAHLLDRAGDVTLDELRARVADASERSSDVDPASEILADHRAISIPLPTAGGEAWRVILAESFSRYAAAFGENALSRVRVGTSLELLTNVNAVLSAELRAPVLEAGAARREILARFVSLAGAVTVREIRERYDWPAEWIERRLVEWHRAGKLVTGRFRGGETEPEWCARRLWEVARRRALAALRRQIEAVELPAFAAFLQRWQHLQSSES